MKDPKLLKITEKNKKGENICTLETAASTGCPKINFTFLNVNNVRTNIRIATPAIYIDRGHL